MPTMSPTQQSQSDSDHLPIGYFLKENAGLSVEQPRRQPSLLKFQSSSNIPIVQSSQRPRGHPAVKILTKRASRVALSIGKNRKASSKDREEADGIAIHHASCTPPKPSKHYRQVVQNRSLEAEVTREETGVSSSLQTSVSPISPRHLSLAGSSITSYSSLSQDMGQHASKSSRVKRKGSQEKISLDSVQTSPPDISIDRIGLLDRSQSPIVQPGLNLPKLPVPRRRSSLTVINLDSEGFHSPIPGQPTLRHRASTLTSTFRKPLELPKTGALLAIGIPNDRPSPDLLSPKGSSERPSSSRQSSKSWGLSRSPSYFPKTLITSTSEIPRPPIMKSHHTCYSNHRRMVRSSNKYYPVPCMTCGTMEGHLFFSCVWCSLRICGECTAEFQVKQRDLKALVDWIKSRSRPSSNESRRSGGAKGEPKRPVGLYKVSNRSGRLPSAGKENVRR